MRYASQWKIEGVAKIKGEGRAFFMALDTFGKRIRALRQEKEWSQIELRDEIKKRADFEIGETYISELERTSKMPSLEVATAIAKTLDVSLDYLGFLVDDSSLSYRRVQPPTYFSNEADEIARLVDGMSPAQRGVLIQIAQDMAAMANDRKRRQAEQRDILDSIERELGRDARIAYENILRSKGLYIGDS